MRKPTVTAWLSNLLARERPDSLRPLAELGAQLQAAQQRLQGSELRELSKQRGRVVYALAREARELAGQHGLRVSEQVARELEQTLEATLADPTIADTVLAGRLTAAVQHAGFGTGGVVSRAARVPPSRAGAGGGAGGGGGRSSSAFGRTGPAGTQAASRGAAVGAAATDGSRGAEGARSATGAEDSKGARAPRGAAGSKRAGLSGGSKGAGQSGGSKGAGKSGTAGTDELAERRRIARRANAERDVADAERAVREATDTAEQARLGVEDLDHRQAELLRRIDELTEALRLAEEELPATRRDGRRAGRDSAKAAQARDRAERILQRACDALATLD